MYGELLLKRLPLSPQHSPRYDAPHIFPIMGGAESLSLYSLKLRFFTRTRD